MKRRSFIGSLGAIAVTPTIIGKINFFVREAGGPTHFPYHNPFFSPGDVVYLGLKDEGHEIGYYTGSEIIAFDPRDRICFNRVTSITRIASAYSEGTIAI